MKAEKNKMKNNNEGIAVSIIVAIYNMEKYLRRFLDSVVYQTLPNIEIILVNKESTDRSLEICREYEKKYKDKVFVYDIPYSDTPSAGRNFGVTVARGEYYYFCDADDLVAYKAMEWLYTKAQEDNADMVCGYAEVIFEDGTVRQMGRLHVQEYDNTKAVLSNASYWCRIIRRELFEKVGKIPENTVFDDLPYIPFINQKAQKCAYIDKPVYYYFRRAGSTVGKLNNRTMIDNIWCMRHLLEDEENPYRDEVLAFIASRINGDLTARYIYGDQLLVYLKEIWRDIANNKYVQEKKGLYSTLERYVGLSDSLIPKKIYVNGFQGEKKNSTEEEIIPPFYDEYETVILNESNCDVHANQAVQTAYVNKNYDFVAKYFALKYIYQQGGFYIGNSVVIDNPINYLRIYPAVFSFMDQTNFTDDLFGASAANEVVKNLLDTYEVDFYDDYEYSLAKRIKNILNVQYNVVLNGCASFFQYPFVLLSPEMTIFLAENAEKHFTHIDFSSLPKEDVVSLPKTVFDYTISHTPMDYIKMERDKNRFQSGFQKYQRENKKLLEDRKKYISMEKDYNRLKKEGQTIAKVKDNLEKQILRVSIERDRLSKENDRISAENQQLLIEKTTYYTENLRLDSDNGALNSKLSWVVEERNRLTRENDRIAYQIAMEKKEKSELRTCLSKAQNEIVNINEEKKTILNENLSNRNILNELQKIGQERDAYEKQTRMLQQRIYLLEESTSWRATKWLRTIGDLLRHK